MASLNHSGERASERRCRVIARLSRRKISRIHLPARPRLAAITTPSLRMTSRQSADFLAGPELGGSLP